MPPSLVTLWHILIKQQFKMELKVYFSNQGWQGSVTIIAPSWEIAFEHSKSEYSVDFTFEQFKNLFKEYKIEDGLTLVCGGYA